MAQNCSHCNKPIGCGCQSTTASDKKTVHKSCKIAYETAIKQSTVNK